MRAVPEPAALAGKRLVRTNKLTPGLASRLFGRPFGIGWLVHTADIGRGLWCAWFTVDQKKRPLRKSGAVFGQSAVGLSRSFYFQA